MVGSVRVAIVGGGILGTAHALEAIGRGHEVVQFEREVEARGATVRNFGLVWVSGPAASWPLRYAHANCGNGSAPRFPASASGPQAR
jgi:glycine/D-amino acid oxidase-like deaminating enzyme